MLFKEHLELSLGRPVSLQELKQILEMATDDIRENNINISKKKTRLADALLVVELCGLANR